MQIVRVVVLGSLLACAAPTDPKEAALIAAAARHSQTPDDLDAAIWHGRQLGYLGRFDAAIEVYTRALAQHQDDPHLLRHRGHRHISLRQFEAAVADLTRAAAGLVGRPDEVEPDGIPNARNTPTSTLHSNVWYHLGLAHFLRQEYDDALRAYGECEKVARNPDMLAATLHWKYTTLRRLGRHAEASVCVAGVRADWDIIENHDYHRLLLMYRGDLDLTAMLATLEGGKATTLASAGFGVASYLRADGRRVEADALCRRIVAEAPVAAFGRIAAEVDLGR